MGLPAIKTPFPYDEKIGVRTALDWAEQKFKIKLCPRRSFVYDIDEADIFFIICTAEIPDEVDEHSVCRWFRPNEIDNETAFYDHITEWLITTRYGTRTWWCPLLPSIGYRS